jgi:hypothetical protein
MRAAASAARAAAGRCSQPTTRRRCAPCTSALCHSRIALGGKRRSALARTAAPPSRRRARGNGTAVTAAGWRPSRGAIALSAQKDLKSGDDRLAGDDARRGCPCAGRRPTRCAAAHVIKPAVGLEFGWRCAAACCASCEGVEAALALAPDADGWPDADRCQAVSRDTGPRGLCFGRTGVPLVAGGTGGCLGLGRLVTVTVRGPLLGLTKLLPALLLRQRGGTDAAEVTPDLHAVGHHGRSLP